MQNMNMFEKNYPKKADEFYYVDVSFEPAKHVVMPEREIQHAKELDIKNFRPEFDIEEQCSLELLVTTEHLSKSLLCKDYYQEGSIYLIKNDLIEINQFSDQDKKNKFICGYGDDTTDLGSYYYVEDNKELRILLSEDIDAATFGIRSGVEKVIILIKSEHAITLRAIIILDSARCRRPGEPEIGRFLYYHEDNSIHIPASDGQWLSVQTYNKVMA